MQELTEGFELKRRKAKDAPVMYVGHFTEAEKDRGRYAWTLERRRGFLRKPETVKVHGIIAQEMEALLARGAAGKAAAGLIARSLIALDAVDRAWAHLCVGNVEALQVRLTTHRAYTYQRETRTLNWRDDLTAPTPPSPALARRRDLRPLLGHSSPSLSVPRILRDKDTEKEYQSYARDVDVQIMRPDLFVHIEPFVTTLMERGKEAAASLKDARKHGKDLIWQKKKESDARRARAQSANVASASDAVAALNQAYSAPGEEILSEAKLTLEQDSAAHEEGERVWDAFDR